MKKIYYSIGEVSRETGLETHVLRFWETQFPELKPEKTSANIRRYRKEDIQLILRIKELLYDEEYTINGARKKLSEMENSVPSATVGFIREEISKVLKLLS